MTGQEQAQQPRKLRIKWPAADVTITVQMHDMNKIVVDLLWETLPYRSLQTHALVTGDHLYHLVPSEALIYTSPTLKIPDRTEAPDGTVFLSTFQHLAIKYGPVTEHHPAAPCGNVVPEDMDKLRSIGNKIWRGQLEEKLPYEVILWDASQPEPDSGSLSLRLQRPGVTKEVKELVKEIHDQMDYSWSGISDDVRRIHSGLAPDRPGSKKSYFAAMLFSNSETRAMGYYVFDNILKVAAKRPEFTLSQLIALYRDFVPTTAEFLGYVGHSFLRDSHRKIDYLITHNVESNDRLEEAREDFLAMVSVLAQYINLLNAQNLHMFPWKHTAEYPIEPK